MKKLVHRMKGIVHRMADQKSRVIGIFERLKILMKKIVLFLSTCLLSICGTAQNFEWIKSMGASGAYSTMGNAIAVDHWGNVYTVGWFENTVDFDPSAGNFDI